VASFCSATGVLNLVFPLTRSSFRASRPERYRFAHPLSLISGSWEVARELFGLGLAFLAPVVPLAFMKLRMYQADFDLTLLGVGATIMCTLLGGILLSITTSQLYTMFVGGEAFVEIDRQPLRSGDDTPFFVSYETGRLVPQRIRVCVVCNKTRNRELLSNGKRQWGSRRPTKIETFCSWRERWSPSCQGQPGAKLPMGESRWDTAQARRPRGRRRKARDGTVTTGNC
jgi:hypothetical protein